MFGHNCDGWDNVYTEIKLFLQLSVINMFLCIIWLLLYFKKLYNTDRYTKIKTN